ncbi:hypothetical protein KBG31_00875 [Patescibacteria group bacterium]|nr:hypothetical protein [Patescibacteria group bacterium]
MTNKNKSSIKVYVNIVPLIIIFLLIGGAGYFLFGQDIKLPSFKPEDSIKVTRIDGFPYRINVKEPREKTRKIIKSEEELTAYMAEIDPEGQIDLRENFNFNKNFLVAVSTETIQDPWTKYRIKRVERDSRKQKLTVEHELTVPVTECPEEKEEEETTDKADAEETTQAIIVDMIQISKTNWEVELKALTRKLPCNEF